MGLATDSQAMVGNPDPCELDHRNRPLRARLVQDSTSQETDSRIGRTDARIQKDGREKLVQAQILHRCIILPSPSIMGPYLHDMALLQLLDSLTRTRQVQTSNWMSQGTYEV